MASTMKVCRCGVRIPNTWLKCAGCAKFARTDSIQGGIEHRMERFQGVLIALEHNSQVEPPLGRELLALLAGEISKRAQEQSILGIQRVSRMLAHENLKIRLANS